MSTRPATGCHGASPPRIAVQAGRRNQPGQRTMHPETPTDAPEHDRSRGWCRPETGLSIIRTAARRRDRLRDERGHEREIQSRPRRWCHRCHPLEIRVGHLGATHASKKFAASLPAAAREEGEHAGCFGPRGLLGFDLGCRAERDAWWIHNQVQARGGSMFSKRWEEIGRAGSGRSDPCSRIAGAAADELKVGDNAAPAFSLARLRRQDLHARPVQREVGGGHRLVPQGVHRRLHQGMQVAPREQQGAQGPERRLFHRQRRHARREQEVRRVARPRLPDPQRPRQDASPRPTASSRSTRGFANRWTFYIDKDGIIKEIDKEVKVDKAGADVAAKVKELGLRRSDREP